MWRATLSLLNLSAARQVIRANFMIGSSYSAIAGEGGSFSKRLSDILILR